MSTSRTRIGVDETFVTNLPLAAAANSAITIDTAGTSGLLVAIKSSGTTGVVSFETTMDGGATWYAIPARSVSSTPVASNTVTLSTNGGWFTYVLPTLGLPRVRLRVSTVLAGQAIVAYTVIGNMNDPFASVSFTSAQSVITTPTTGSPVTLVTAATTNATVVKASAGHLFELTVSNVTATAAYVKLYNKTTAPTVGTDVPVLTIPVPANTTLAFQFGGFGKRFAAGIAAAVTGAIAATDTTATVAGIQLSGTYL